MKLNSANDLAVCGHATPVIFVWIQLYDGNSPNKSGLCVSSLYDQAPVQGSHGVVGHRADVARNPSLPCWLVVLLPAMLIDCNSQFRSCGPGFSRPRSSIWTVLLVGQKQRYPNHASITQIRTSRIDSDVRPLVCDFRILSRRNLRTFALNTTSSPD